MSEVKFCPWCHRRQAECPKYASADCEQVRDERIVAEAFWRGVSAERAATEPPDRRSA